MSRAGVLVVLTVAGCGEQESTVVSKSEFEDTPIEAPEDISPEVFKKWRNARRGKGNPEDLSNPYWEWLIRSETSSYAANQHFGGPSSYGGSAAWSADRFGQSVTELPDGRKISIAGEHEDYYDPDFFIYNDVFVEHPDGQMEIFGYSREVFPPTDFHSATLVGERIIMVGNLGYGEDRRPGECQILILDTETMEISKQEAEGESPGWISRHAARWDEEKESIEITGGEVESEGDVPLMENIDDWRLDVTDWRWERLTKREWPLFALERVDGEFNELWSLRNALMQQGMGRLELPAESRENLSPEMAKELEEAMNPAPPEDPEMLEALYKPASVPHRVLPEREEEFGVYRIEIEGVVIRFVEDMDGIMMTVEGELPEAVVEAVRSEVLEKVSKVEGVDYKFTQLRP